MAYTIVVTAYDWGAIFDDRGRLVGQGHEWGDDTLGEVVDKLTTHRVELTRKGEPVEIVYSYGSKVEKTFTRMELNV